MANDKVGYYNYNPSVAAAAIFVIVFAALSSIHVFRLVTNRTWFCLPFLVGGLFEVIGYAARLVGHYNPDSLPPYVVQALLILLAPILFAASIYMILGRIIRTTGAQAYSLVRVTWMTKIFVGGDVLCFLIQALGGAMLANADTPSQVSRGQHIILAGLILQILIFAFFLTVAGVFQQRLRRKPTESSCSGAAIGWQGLMVMLYTVSIFITVRNVFRVIEYAAGDDGYLLQNEWPIYVFDAFLMSIVLLICIKWYDRRISSRFETINLERVNKHCQTLVMVYKGPSKGCYKCRQRRVKCDEQQPQCGNCIKRKQQCPGYRDRFDAFHKDETLMVSHKHGSKRPRQWDEVSDVGCKAPTARPTTRPPLPRPKKAKDGCPDLSILIQPSPNTETECLCYFFNNYVTLPRDPSTNIFIEHILPVYLMAAPGSALGEAVTAVAINVTQTCMIGYCDFHLSREAYGRAVTLLKALLRDPVESKKDETLATVFILDFCDSLNQRDVHFTDSGTHQQGAIALLKHRGADNFKSPIAQRLFNAMRSRHISYSLQSGKKVDLDPALLEDDTAILPSAKLDLINVELADLHVLAREGPEARHQSPAAFYQEVLEKALVLENKLQTWRTSLPESWQPVAVPVSELHHSILDAGVYENMCDVYSSLAVSHVNNSQRISHVSALRLIELCSQSLRDLREPFDPSIERNVGVRTQEIVDRFCASIPYHLGNRTTPTYPHEHREYPHVPLSLRRLAKYVDAFGAEVGMTMEDHIRGAAAIGRWLTPLAGFQEPPALRSSSVRPRSLTAMLRKGQLQWIRVQMARIQRTYYFSQNHRAGEL
ncbi:uncharacterized protein PV07_03158 [Cladophialophora immunda]|uniref:Zn(2)-C6 fungal-type domain-containing protein n=1 Tax=Cladophialophora immunda TaxID=569365 RepID=A0A0D2CK63_9EURO|nr:uncharacterized protein PV07_03158 [Cladophialophora immunda]KIW31513.1 hypothetical protein PV07_03158 [Cladophialophora immunda]